MEERYEIREKIGQGGMGAVFRAYDMRMNREVAIKRIQQEGEGALQQATSQQIVKEAGALASLQHPHIVTVYDVGSDAEGPYVVMELISGKTLDELIERAPLTWPDFRELALQTQEALIAAQELNLIHRDLKPGNLMLTWLPSGRFQVKIVDFGLAHLAGASALDHLENAEAVYGSIFFMCPEHFERTRLDMRSDMYSIGCVYYNALAGIYPFNGDTGLQVMTAHLHHEVIPLQEVRPDIPLWACDWVMWHLNRLTTDRPQNARESLKVFLQNAHAGASAMRTTSALSATGLIRMPRAISPGAVAPGAAMLEAPRTQTAPLPLLPPEGSKPSVHASPPPPPPPPPPVLPPVPPAPPPAPRLRPAPKPTPIPQAALGPLVAKALGAGHVAAMHPEHAALAAPKRRPLSKQTKIAIAPVVAIVLVLVALVMKTPSPQMAALTGMLRAAALEDARKVPDTEKELSVTQDSVGILLKATLTPAATKTPARVYLALRYAKAAQGSEVDVDDLIVAFLIKHSTNDHYDTQLLEVLGKRRNPAVVPPLLEFCRNTTNTVAAHAAIMVCRSLATDNDFATFIDILGSSGNPAIRQAAEDAAAAILEKSSRRLSLGITVSSSLTTANHPEVKYALIRLQGCVGGVKAAATVTAALAASDKNEQLAAAMALAAWPDDSMFERLIDYLGKLSDSPSRALVLDACVRFLANPQRTRTPASNLKLWDLLASCANSPAENAQLAHARAAHKK
ncbi:MAG: serine/threonine protein kinase [Verrucomicrobia bacterium]|nr:MAG: serine/threonine protein kinase [Verrucomicrobiota bacterium]